MRIISESGFYKLIARSRKATTPGTLLIVSVTGYQKCDTRYQKNGDLWYPVGCITGFSRRKEQYQISASEKGRELQACKRKKRELEEEEKTLIREYQPEFYLVTAFSDKTKATAKGSPVGTRENKSITNNATLRLVGNVISQIWFVPRFATRAFPVLFKEFLKSKRTRCESF
ncbi:putative prophage antirepressor [Escherichia coli]|nr:putative prophage antirepressor [Escherichia coli]